MCGLANFGGKKKKKKKKKKKRTVAGHPRPATARPHVIITEMHMDIHVLKGAYVHKMMHAYTNTNSEEIVYGWMDGWMNVDAISL